MFKIFIPSSRMNWFLGNPSVRGDLESAYLKTWESRAVNKQSVGFGSPTTGIPRDWLTQPKSFIFCIWTHPSFTIKTDSFQENSACVFSECFWNGLQCGWACSSVCRRAALSCLAQSSFPALLICKTSLWVTGVGLGWNAQLTCLFCSKTS